MLYGLAAQATQIARQLVVFDVEDSGDLRCLMNTHASQRYVTPAMDLHEGILL